MLLGLLWQELKHASYDSAVVVMVMPYTLAISIMYCS